MAMLGGECSPCCEGGCCPSWGAAKRFIQSLAPLDGTEYTGLSINGEIQDTTFTVQSQSGGAEFIGSQVYPSTVRTGRNSAVAFARSDRNGCVYGFAQVSVPLGGYFLNAQGDRFRLSFGDDRYPTPPNDGSIVAVVPYYLLYVFFNWNSSPPSIDVFTSIRSTWFWVNNTSMPLITGVRFGGKSITATPWDGLSAPTIDNAVFGNAANIFPSSNCRRTQVDQRRVLEVPDSDYRGTLEIDLAFFRRFVAGVDENGDNLAGYALAESRTVTVQWDDMTEFEVDEDCSGACCEVDGSCNIKPQCECDTDNGAVFAGVGETCEACYGCCYRESQPPTRTTEANCEEWGWGVQRFDPGFPEIDLPVPGVQGYGIYATQQQAQAAGDAWVAGNTQGLEGFYDVYTRKLSSFATDEICCDCGGESLPGYADLSITNFTTDDPVLPNFFQGLSMRIPLGVDYTSQVDGSTGRRYDSDPNFACTVYEASLQDPTPCGTADSTGIYTRVAAPFAGSTNVGFIFSFTYCRQQSPAGSVVPSQPGGFAVFSPTFHPATQWSSPFLGSECSLPLTTSGSITLATRGNTYPVDEGLIYTTSFDYTITIPSPSNPLP